MDSHRQSEHADGHHDAGHAVATFPAPEAAYPRQRLGFGQRLGIILVLFMLVVPPAAGFYSYFSGTPLHLLASSTDKDDDEKEKAEKKAAAADPDPSHSSTVCLVPGQAHTVQVPDEVAGTLGISRGKADQVAVAKPPTAMRPLVLPGSTAIDPSRLDRIRARFAPARVVEIGKVWDHSPKTGQSERRELRPGDRIAKGDVLGVFYSVDVASKKTDLLNALVQLNLDQANLDEAEKHAEAVPPILLRSFEAAVRTDRNAIGLALNYLHLWDIPQDEIDALQVEAKKIAADKDSWSKTPEGRWVKGEKLSADKAAKERENPWGRVTLRADFDGVIVERNVHAGEMVVDNTVNLFQIADVDRLLVIASCPEDSLPTLESLDANQKRWVARTVGASSVRGVAGTIDEIGYLIDPNQHTAVIKGFIENPGNHIRAGQYVTATVEIPPPGDVVEIPTDALVDDGLQSLVFVQPDPNVRRFSMRRVSVTHRFEHTVFVRSVELPKEMQLTDAEAEEGLLPQQALRPGERVLLAGAVELKAAVLELESRLTEKKPAGATRAPAGAGAPAHEGEVKATKG